MSKIKVTKIKSAIKKSKNQKLVLESLGLKKIRSSVIHNKNSNILGMIAKVHHLVTVEELN